MEIIRDPDYHRRPTAGDVVRRLSVPEMQLLRNLETEEAVTSKLGDEPTVSENSYQDLQVMYS